MRFEANPEAYTPEGERPVARPHMTAKLVEELLDWSLNVKGNTGRWVGQQASRRCTWLSGRPQLATRT